MAKFCIFCGHPPTDKNKEHVVPRWLIKLTGDPKRIVRLGFNFDEEKKGTNREFPFDKFTFPACESCNTKYSYLESEVHILIRSILDGRPINSLGISRILDWLDKVRVGLWLGFHQLNKNMLEVQPGFYIEQRIGQFDRILIVERTGFTDSRLCFFGADTASFGFTPSAFGLVINNYFFTNVSYAFLLARRLGFPYSTELQLDPHRAELRADLLPGRDRVMKPVIKRAMSEKVISFYQPMFAQGLVSQKSNLYDSAYVRNHSFDHSAGVGAIFAETENAAISVLTSSDDVLVAPPVILDDEEHFIRSMINICNWQNWITDNTTRSDLLTPEQRRFVRGRQRVARTINDTLIAHHEALLRKRGFPQKVDQRGVT